jgi:hypothetical protein
MISLIVHVDHHLGDEKVMLRKTNVGLGFNTENVDYIVDKGLN